MNLLIRFLVNVVAILLIAAIVPGIHVSGVFAACIVAVVLGLINITLKPLLILLTLPATILTLGLFVFVINALMLWLAAAIVKGFYVDSFLAALLGSLVITLMHLIANRLEPKH